MNEKADSHTTKTIQVLGETVTARYETPTGAMAKYGMSWRAQMVINGETYVWMDTHWNESNCRRAFERVHQHGRVDAIA